MITIIFDVGYVICSDYSLFRLWAVWIISWYHSTKYQTQHLLFTCKTFSVWLCMIKVGKYWYVLLTSSTMKMQVMMRPNLEFHDTGQIRNLKVQVIWKTKISNMLSKYKSNITNIHNGKGLTSYTRILPDLDFRFSLFRFFDLPFFRLRFFRLLWSSLSSNSLTSLE